VRYDRSNDRCNYRYTVVGRNTENDETFVDHLYARDAATADRLARLNPERGVVDGVIDVIAVFDGHLNNRSVM
jgi:hypothetical protein